MKVSKYKCRISCRHFPSSIKDEYGCGFDKNDSKTIEEQRVHPCPKSIKEIIEKLER